MSALPTAPAADVERPTVARQTLDIAAYAARNGYYLKNGWWWRDAGYGVLHALYDEDSTYGIGLMMSTQTSEARTKQAVDRMGTALYELELGSQFALDLMDYYQGELDRYADTFDAEYSTSISLHGRQVEVSFWWSESQVGSAVGTMLDIAKP